MTIPSGHAPWRNAKIASANRLVANASVQARDFPKCIHNKSVSTEVRNPATISTSICGTGVAAFTAGATAFIVASVNMMKYLRLQSSHQ